MNDKQRLTSNDQTMFIIHIFLINLNCIYLVHTKDHKLMDNSSPGFFYLTMKIHLLMRFPTYFIIASRCVRGVFTCLKLMNT